jgi:hypothetical protein
MHVLKRPEDKLKLMPSNVTKICKLSDSSVRPK